MDIKYTNKYTTKPSNKSSTLGKATCGSKGTFSNTGSRSYINKNTNTTKSTNKNKGKVESSSESEESESETSSDEEELNFTVDRQPVNANSVVTFKREECGKLFDEMVIISPNEAFYSDIAKIKLKAMFAHYSEIKSKIEAGVNEFKPICALMEKVFVEDIKALNKMMSDGKITFENLKKVLTVGKQVVGKAMFGEKVGAIITRANVSSNGIMNILYVTCNAMASNGHTFVPKQVRFAVPEYPGFKDVTSLQVRLMNDADKKYLIKRGQEYLKYALKHHYKNYKGSMIVQTYFGPSLEDATGRLVIDTHGHSRYDPNGYYDDGEDYDDDGNPLTNAHSNDQSSALPEDKVHLLYPFLPAFSFVRKRWGELFIRNICDITFDDDAYSKLVLEEEKKQVVKTLVTNAKCSFTDIISNKSGGCIFLLYGPPGTGKTLTAESVAELLHVPLYSVTSGELGTSSQQVENKLSNILALAQSWGAIILIDEADVFLEKRNSENLERNAIVSIFLRLLERYSGIMFLTTNRKTEIDEAFQSRIAVSFEYKFLTENERFKVFKNLLEAAKIQISDETIGEFAKLEINGRQIKNLIRLAHTLAIDEKVDTNVEHFEKIFKICGRDYGI